MLRRKRRGLKPTISRRLALRDHKGQNIIALVNQFQLADLSNKQKVEILAEFLASTIHLHSHCNENLQNLIAEELEKLPDDVEDYNL